MTCGLLTHIVSAVDISGWAVHDQVYFRPLVEQTSKNFQIRELSADKAHTSHTNLTQRDALGATPFIPFKVNAAVPKTQDTWAKMYH